jgi:hypothetical protein
VLAWFQKSDFSHITIHSDPISAIVRAGHTRAGPGQGRAINIRTIVCECRGKGKMARITWVKGHEGTPGNERADVLAGKAAEKAGYSKVVSLAHLKLQISEKFREAKTAWHGNRAPWDRRNSAPPPKKSCLDKMRNALAPTAAQIRTGPEDPRCTSSGSVRWWTTSVGSARARQI